MFTSLLFFLIRVAARFLSGIPHPHLLGAGCPDHFSFPPADAIHANTCSAASRGAVPRTL